MILKAHKIVFVSKCRYIYSSSVSRKQLLTLSKKSSRVVNIGIQSRLLGSNNGSSIVGSAPSIITKAENNIKAEYND